MKEQHFFYVPNAKNVDQLPDEEAQHAVRVLRLREGDDIMLTDGEGSFCTARITEVGKSVCRYEIVDSQQQTCPWKGKIHLAVAPTKHLDRMEWLVEKATEIGIDELTFLNCTFSERKVLKLPRLERIVVSAMKQSKQAFKPVLNDLVDVKEFLRKTTEQQRFICHCYGPESGLGQVKDLTEAMVGGKDTVILIGPEGDFSVDEVKLAESLGFQSVSLSKNRLRTETAALVAVHILSLFNTYNL